MDATEAAVLTLTAILGGVVDHVYKYWRREKKIVRCIMTSREIVDGTRAGASLEVRYKGSLVTRVVSHSVLIRNDGNCPLRGIPVWIASDGGRFIEFEVLGSPEGELIEPHAEKGGTVVIVPCDLLNPGDMVSIGLTAVDTNTDELTVTARAENLVCLTGLQEAPRDQPFR